MPIYAFRCPEGHTTKELLCKSDLSDAPRTCQVLVGGADHFGQRICGKPLERVLAAPASVFPGADRWRGGL